MSNQPYISILIPLYDELRSIPEMHSQVTDACTRLGRTYEVLWIDDGSRDGSAHALDDLAARDPRSRVVHFRRNFGKSSALAAGFERVRGQIVITMDADLQDDPAMIDDFVKRIEAGADLVSGWKKRRHDPLDKTLPSRLFNAVVSRLSGVRLHDFNCGFKAYRADCVRELAVYGGFHRFLPVLAHHKGFRVEELIVKHRARKHGKSKYGVKRMFDGFMDLLTVLLVTRYRTRPLHFFGIPGMVLGGLGVLILVYLSFLWMFGYAIGERPLLTLGVLLTIVAMQFVGVGLLGELLVRTTIRSQEVFSIRDEREAPAATRAAIYAQPSPQLGPSAPPMSGRELPVSAAEEISEDARTVTVAGKPNPANPAVRR
ncbi:Glycosyltransferase involved in cell wall bisynthesis [Nannocystis exedens]|uniref:Glycosyltransferase involved in cell wall bisynthesis n=1 Tax=Nannocystis exedens TaxID=54 RepID=A0A1I1VR99_9BACT|nr:glycosyltransferase family 2 protein [Nannocystis exedens]PCC72759.1 glycosyl transferase, group 2 family protein [Nannocystis exedens]SFD85374.1 Glycosyltransferase involved in cell wall bisynthesis [Nannocystis exedens]